MPEGLVLRRGGETSPLEGAGSRCKALVRIGGWTEDMIIRNCSVMVRPPVCVLCNPRNPLLHRPLRSQYLLQEWRSDGIRLSIFLCFPRNRTSSRMLAGSLSPSQLRWSRIIVVSGVLQTSFCGYGFDPDSFLMH